MKFYLTLALSAIIHIVILIALSYSGTDVVKIKPQAPKPVIQAQLMFTPKPMEPVPVPVPVPAPQPTPKPVKEQRSQVAFEEPKPVAKPSVKPSTKPKTKAITETTTKPTVVSNQPFNPQSSIASLVAENDQAFFDSITSTIQSKPSHKSINSLDPNSSDQSGLKAIFETAVRIDSDTRVVNYGGRCVQIKRELDHNGFSQFRWTGTSQDCGQDDKMKEQLKLSLRKFVR